MIEVKKKRTHKQNTQNHPKAPNERHSQLTRHRRKFSTLFLLLARECYQSVWIMHDNWTETTISFNCDKPTVYCRHKIVFILTYTRWALNGTVHWAFYPCAVCNLNIKHIGACSSRLCSSFPFFFLLTFERWKMIHKPSLGDLFF